MRQYERGLLDLLDHLAHDVGLACARRTEKRLLLVSLTQAIDEGSDRLRLVGVDDPSGRYIGEPCETNEMTALPSEPDSRFTILLKHRPSVREKSLGRFDLQLSGHSHGGQIVPFNWIVNMVYPLLPGLHELGKGSLLYHSPGTCTWGPPIRLFSRPEVTLLLLKAP